MPYNPHSFGGGFHYPITQNSSFFFLFFSTFSQSQTDPSKSNSIKVKTQIKDRNHEHNRNTKPKSLSLFPQKQLTNTPFQLASSVRQGVDFTSYDSKFKFLFSFPIFSQPPTRPRSSKTRKKRISVKTQIEDTNPKASGPFHRKIYSNQLYSRTS